MQSPALKVRRGSARRFANTRARVHACLFKVVQKLFGTSFRSSKALIHSDEYSINIIECLTNSNNDNVCVLRHSLLLIKNCAPQRQIHSAK